MRNSIRWILPHLLLLTMTALADPPSASQPLAPTPQEIRAGGFNRRSPIVIAVERVKGAVVNISSTRLVKVRYGGFDDELFDRYFGGLDSPFSRTVQATSLGSGVIIHPAGYVLTNAHVVARATEVTCTLPGTNGGNPENQQKLEAKIIAADPAQDLAVLKIEPPKDKPLPFLPMGHSNDLMIGETVIAIGNAMGYSHTVTTGVVSAIERDIKLSDELKLDHLVQTDASINPGNSGGPLLNVNGELIGINTAIRSDAQNIGFAIPIDQARKELAYLLDFERINEVVFGATLDDRDGLKVTAVRPKTPAEAAGLTAGDIVQSVDGKPCNALLEFDVLMLSAKADQTLKLTVTRKESAGPKTHELKLTMAALPRPDGNELLWKFYGMKVRPVDAELAKQFGLRQGVGLVITQMANDSPAVQIRMHVGDVIVQVDKLMLSTLDQLGQSLKQIKTGDYARIGFLRGRTLIWAQLKAK